MVAIKARTKAKEGLELFINRTELAEKAGFSRGTITKMGRNEPVGLDVILKICNHLDCGIEDVVSILPNDDPA